MRHLADAEKRLSELVVEEESEEIERDCAQFSLRIIDRRLELMDRRLEYQQQEKQKEEQEEQ
ncbi:hypothetical protein KEM55_002436 [Ascosphaera atra]|nr:hypothetical protein KEM55_002436 [Ascosphaera atra]